MNYNLLEFSGKMLLPSFSVYLYHFKHPNGNFYYVGMTGDNYYPSARSAIHRLSGHFELQKRSTQNQLNKRIIEMGGENWINEVDIRYFHWPIKGFKPVLNDKSTFHPSILDNSQISAYERFLSRRREVLALEKHLISVTKLKVDDRCWNKAVSLDSKCPVEFTDLAKEVLYIVV